MAEGAKMLAAAVGSLSPRRAVLAALAEEEVNGRRLTTSQAARLRKAAGLSIGSLEDRRQAADLVRRVEAELAAVRLGEAVDAGIDDTIARMTARGEIVKDGEADEAEFIRDRFGAVMRHQGEPMMKVRRVRRIGRVDGLKSLHRSGALTDWELGVAMRCRSLVEKARPPISSGQLNPVRVDGGASGTSDELVVAALARADSAVRLALIMKAVRPWQDIFNSVVVRGCSLNACGGDGNVRRANLADLKAGLAAADALLMTRENVLVAVLP